MERRISWKIALNYIIKKDLTTKTVTGGMVINTALSLRK